MIDHTIDRERWAQMTIFEQMGNIYSEVGRTFNARRTGRLEDENMATKRAIDLFDATIDNLVQSKSVRAKEVLRAKDLFLNNLNSTKFDETDAASLEKYFMQFAIAARINR